MRTNTTQSAQIDSLAATEAAIHRRRGGSSGLRNGSGRASSEVKGGMVCWQNYLERSCCRKSDKTFAPGGQIDKSIDGS